MKIEDWDWSRPIFDHVDVHASDYANSVRFYKTVLAPLGIPRIAETEEWTCFTNLNVVERTPASRTSTSAFAHALGMRSRPSTVPV